MPIVRRSNQAKNDLIEIWLNIAEDHPSAADAFIDDVERTLYLLSTQPLMGRERPEIRAGVRSHPFGRYVIFYRPVPDGLFLGRVLHSAMDVVDPFASVDEE